MPGAIYDLPLPSTPDVRGWPDPAVAPGVPKSVRRLYISQLAEWELMRPIALLGSVSGA